MKPWADREGSFEQRKEAEMTDKTPQPMSAESLEASASPSRESEVGAQMAGSGSIPDAGIPSTSAVDISREAYDRFVMGGWEPADFHEQAQQIIDQHTATIQHENILLVSQVADLRAQLAEKNIMIDQLKYERIGQRVRDTVQVDKYNKLLAHAKAMRESLHSMRVMFGMDAINGEPSGRTTDNAEATLKAFDDYTRGK